MRHTRSAVLLSLALLVVLFACAAPTAAQTAASTGIDGSAISSGMGGASGAVFWSPEPSYWANPALLGYYHGIGYQHAYSRLVPGLAPDVYFNSDRVTLATCGVGFEFAGRPFEGEGGTKLDYGTSTIVDGEGNPLGTFSSYEKVSTFGVGVSLSELVRSIAPASRAAAWGRRYDLALGYARKNAEILLAPDMLGGHTTGVLDDIGMLARGSFDLGPAPGGSGAPCRLDVSLAGSVLNANDAKFVFISEDMASPAVRMRRLGGAARFAVGLPPAWTHGAGAVRSALLRGLDPLLSIGLAFDDEHVSAGDSQDGAYNVGHGGVEAAFLHVLAVRFGRVSDRTGDITANSWGVGVGIPIADVAGARFDYAEYPQSSDLPHVIRHTYSFFLDPVALWRLAKQMK